MLKRLFAIFPAFMCLAAMDMPPRAMAGERTTQETGEIRDEAAPAAHRRRYLDAVCRRIEAEADGGGLPPGFLARLLWQESRFDPNAVSPKGAKGIAQFMPATARERGLDNPFDPHEAIPASAEYLLELAGEFGNLGLAAAAYNAGPARVAAWRAGRGGLPLETRAFVRIVTGLSVEDWARDDPPDADFTLKKDVTFVTACSELRIAAPGDGLRAGAPWQPWGVHLIAHGSRAKALSLFAAIQRGHPALLKDVEPMVLVVRNNSFGRAPRYAVRVGKPNEAEAADLCGKIRAAGGACLVYKTPR